MHGSFIVLHEPRSCPRAHVKLSAQVATLDCGDDRSFTLAASETVDIAGSGLGLVLSEKLTRGQRVLAEVDLESGEVIPCKGRVMWSEERSEGVHVVGISFDELIPELAARAHHAGAAGLARRYYGPTYVA